MRLLALLLSLGLLAPAAHASVKIRSTESVELGDVHTIKGDWTKADETTAVLPPVPDGTCASGKAITAITEGVITCTTVAGGSGTLTSLAAGTGITLTPDPIVTTGTIALTIPVAFANGGTNLTTAADDTTIVSTGSTWQAKALANCPDSGGNHLNYTASSNSFSCGTSSGGVTVPGSDTQAIFNDGGVLGADGSLTIGKTPDLITITGTVDGDYEGLRIVNSQTNAAASTNETAQIRFGFGSNTDVARIVAGKDEDYTAGSDENSFLSFYADNNGTAREIMRVNGYGVSQSTTTMSVQIGDAITATSPTAALMVGQTDTHATKKGDLLQLIGPGPLTYFLMDNAGTARFGKSGAGTTTILSDTGNKGYVKIYGDASNSSPAELDFGHEETTYAALTWVKPSATKNRGYFEFAFTDNAAVDAEQPAIVFGRASPAQVLTLESGLTLATQRFFTFTSPTINGVAGGPDETCSDCDVVWIGPAPSGSNITNSAPHSLHVVGNVKMEGSLDVGGTISVPGIVAGQWSPSANSIANLDASSAGEGQYSRVGATITFSIRVTVDPTAPGSAQLELDLPVASNFGSTDDAAGTCFAPGIAGQGAAVLADTGSDELEVRWIAADLTSQAMYCSGSYQLI